MTRSAIMSMARSRESSSHSVPHGRRYLIVYSRAGPVVSCMLAAPLGHNLPRLIGESGSPSIWVTRSSCTYTFWPHPTAQYGHTDLTTCSAVAVRGWSRLDVALLAADLRPSRSSPTSWRRTGHEVNTF